MFYRLFLLALITSLHANDPTATMLNDPSTLVEGKVNVITGEPSMFETDMVVQGAEPIRISRTYVFLDKKWNWLVNNTFAVYERTDSDYRCQITESHGCPVVFKKAHTLTLNGVRYTRFNPSDLNKGFCNTHAGTASSRTHLKNDYLLLEGTSLDPDDVKFLTYHAADGTVRQYKKVHDPNNPKKRTLRLLSEQLPNGRWVLYDYEETTEPPSSWAPTWLGGDEPRPKFWLKSIRTTNTAQTKVFARADFIYHNRSENSLDYTVLGSDGQAVRYQNSQGRLVTVIPPNGITQYIDYIECWDVMQQKKVRFPQEQTWALDYYRKQRETVNGTTVEMNDDFSPDKRRCRVKTISAPVGDNGTLHTTHSFLYDLELLHNSPHWPQRTSVYDIDGNRTDYQAGLLSRLYKIHRFDKHGKLLNADRFVWGGQKTEGCLLFKTLFDSNEKPLFCKGYVYDEWGNVIEERLYGNLSGQGPPLVLNGFDRPEAAETYLKRYRYAGSEPILLAEEEEPNGKRIVYTYLPGTDLVTSCLVYDKTEPKLRTLFEYNEDHVLIREIHDDGIAYTIRNITPCASGPYAGMPEVIEERYREQGHEFLLRKTVLTYTTGGKIARQDIYDANNVFRYSLRTTYDKHGNPVEQTNPLGQAQRLSYDACGNCVYTQDFSGRTECFTEYDFSNRPVAVECKGDDHVHRKTEYKHNSKHKLIRETDFRGNTTHHTYDPLGRCIETQLPKLPSGIPIVRHTYDAAGNEIASTDPEGNTTTKTVNAYGKPVLVVHPDGAQEKHVYNLDGTLKMHVDAVGVQTTFTYDFLGRVKTKKTASAEELFEYHGQHLVSKTDAEGNKTVYQYDGAGRKISETFAGETTTFSYDALGRLCRRNTGDTVFLVEHDLLDRVLEERQESPAGDVLRKTQFEYDTAGNRSCIVKFVAGKLTREEHHFDSLGRETRCVNALGHTTTVAYEDSPVLRKTTTDPLGLQTIETYNSHNQLVSTEKRHGHTLFLEEISRNKNGLTISQVNTIFAPDGSSRKVLTTWEYDNRSRMRTLTEAAGTLEAKTTRYDYTARGELSQLTKPDGTVLVYKYSPLGFLQELVSSDTSVHHVMEHNRVGHLVGSDSFERVVDAKGRILKEIFRGKYSLENRYDSNGKRLECTIPKADCRIEYGYEASELKSVSRNTLHGRCLYTHVYGPRDLSGNLLEETLIGNLGIVRHEVDALSRKTQVTAPGFQQQVLAFDAVGNVCQLQTQGEHSSFTYDPLYQLTSETGRFAHSYDYDSLCNRLHKDQETYQVNGLQQVVSHMHYTKNGNPDRFGDAQYTYDALDRLIAIHTPRFTQTFTYDCENRCLVRITSTPQTSETRQFLYDGKNEIGAFDEHGQIIEFRVLGNVPHAEIGAAVGLELNGKIFAPVHDLCGNIAALLPLNNEQPTFFRYSAFGECAVFGTTACPWTFSSKRSDDRSGLVYFGRRFYVPVLGRWLTPDPSGFTDGMNLYAFVDNNPLIYIDEYGLAIELYTPPVQYQASWNRNKPQSVSVMGGRGLYSNDNVSPHYYVNGIWNSRKDCIDGGRALLRTHGNAAGIIPVYSPSLGVIKDLRSVFRSVKDPSYNSFAVEYLRRNIAWDCLVLKIMNDPRKIFITGFSRGTADIYHAVKDLTREQKDRLIITGCGGIVMLPKDMGFKVQNLIAEKDACSLHFHSGLRHDHHKFDRVANVHMLPQPPGFGRNFTSHAFANDIYQQGIQRHTVPAYNIFGRLPQ